MSLFTLVKSNVNETSAASSPKTEQTEKHYSECKYERRHRFTYAFFRLLAASPADPSTLPDPDQLYSDTCVTLKSPHIYFG